MQKPPMVVCSKSLKKVIADSGPETGTDQNVTSKPGFFLGQKGVENPAMVVAKWSLSWSKQRKTPAQLVATEHLMYVEGASALTLVNCQCGCGEMLKFNLYIYRF